MLRRSIVTIALACGSVHAALAQTVTVAPVAGHPTVTVTLTGATFTDKEAVDVYFDTTDTLLLVSSATGTLTGSVTIPASAAPGVHYVTAVGRKSGDAAQAMLTVSTPWIEAGYGAAGMNWNPFENTLTTANVAQLGTLWQVPNALATGSTPTVSNGRVYNGTGHGLQALNAATGAILWTKLPTVGFYASPAVFNNIVYAGSNSDIFYAFNATTGANVWSATLGGVVYGSPVVVNGTVYFGSYDNKVYALNASTGKTVWSYTTGAAIDGTPAVVNGVVYIGSEDDKVYALNATTGALLWSYTTKDFVESNIAVGDGLVFAASDDGSLYALTTTASAFSSTTAGTVLWSDTGADFASPAYAAGIVYFGQVTLYAVDARTGAQRWSFAPDSYLRGHPVVANGVIYFCSAGGIFYGLNAATGAELFHTDAGAAYLGGPSISDGVLYLNAFQSGTTAFSLLAGTDLAPRRPPVASMLHPDMTLTATR